MRAGRLRHRISIQQKSVTRDSYGAETITWSTVCTVWGAVEPIRGREFLEQAMNGAELTTRIVIRTQRSESLTPAMRATWGSHVYDIQSIVNVDERDRETQLLCREILDDDDWSGA